MYAILAITGHGTAGGAVIAVFVICILILIFTAVVLGILLKRAGIGKSRAEYLNEQLSKASEIYQVVEDINILADTHMFVRSDEKVKGIHIEEMASAQQALYAGMEMLASDEDKRMALEFVNLSTLEERLGNNNSIIIEYRNSFDNGWRRGRFVASKRTDDGRLSHVLWMIEDINSEKIKREEAERYIKEVNVQMSSLSTIYLTMHDLDIANDTFSEIKIAGNNEDEGIFGDVKIGLQKSLCNIMSQMSKEETKEQILEFIDLKTLDERMSGKTTITCEFLSYRDLWCQGRFIVSKRTPEGKIAKALWLVESIDEEKRKRDELRDISLRAIAESEAKSVFLSNMSHEIKTPINAVVGMNEMILRESKDKSITEYSSGIRTAANTLLGIINDVLDFSKIEDGKMEIVPVEYELEKVLKDLVSGVKRKIDEKDLTLELDIDEKTPGILYGDEVRIKQVISNILSNAAKYTEKGKVTFSVGYKDAEPEGDDGKDYIDLCVAVKDTGIGIKEEDIEKMFSEFTRIDLDKNRTIEGTGLGMAITQNLLNMMGSSLNVESKFGEGSVFSFTLRQQVVKRDPIGDRQILKESDPNGNEYKEKIYAPDANVLVVDDTRMNLVVVKSLLKQTEIKIDTALSGDDGISLAYKKKYDVIFMDHMMPEKDGIETLKELRAKDDHPNTDTPIICLTANAVSGSREKYLSVGFDDYLSKPIDPERLEEMLLTYIPADKIERKIVEKDDKAEAKNDIREAKEVFGDLPGINYKAGLANCGSYKNYRSIAGIFYESISANYKEINDLYESRNIEDYAIKVHALKSQARTIGALEFGDKAEAMEAAGKSRDEAYIDANHKKLMEEYAGFSEILKSVCTDGSDDKDKPLAEDEKVKEWFEKIEEGAREFDVAMIDDALKEMKGFSFKEEDEKKLRAVREKYDRFDYDGIIDAIKGEENG